MLFASNNIQTNKFLKLLKKKYPNCDLEKKENKLFYSEFLSLDIQDCIYKDINNILYIDFNYPLDKSLNLKGTIKLFYSNQDKLKLKNLVRKIVSRVIFFNIYKNVNKLDGKDIIPNINIFLCKEKKNMPKNNIFDVNNVNSAVTDTINSIIIFRKEEILKSILHECIHYHNLDFNFYDYPQELLAELLNNKYYKMDEKNKLRINEAYTEILANMLNIIISITEYYLMKKKNKNNNYVKLDKNILNKYFLLELKFSMYQLNKIYEFINNNDNIDNKHNKEDRKLIQNTSVFSYYVVKCQLFYNLKKLLNKLNYKNTKKLINIKYNIDFTEFHQTFIAFTNLDKKIDDKEKLNLFVFNLINNIIQKNQKLSNTIKSLRMTCIE